MVAVVGNIEKLRLRQSLGRWGVRVHVLLANVFAAKRVPYNPRGAARNARMRPVADVRIATS